MTDQKPTLKSKIKNHLSNNKEDYIRVGCYAAGILVTAASVAIAYKIGGKMIETSWDKARAEGVAKYGEDVMTLMDQQYNFKYITPVELPTK